MVSGAGLQARDTLTVQAPGFAPGTTELTISPELEPITFRLEAGRSIRGQWVVGPGGEPVAGAFVTVDKWRGKRSSASRARPMPTAGSS